MKLPPIPKPKPTGKYDLFGEPTFKDNPKAMQEYGILCAQAALIEAGKVGYRIGLEMQQKYQHAMSNNMIDPFIHDDMRDAVLRIEVKP